MRFDEFWDDDDSPTSVATADQPLLPDGTHNGKIVVAEIKDLKFKQSDRNPEGKTLVVKVAVKGYQLVEDLIPVTMRGLIEAVCRAAGVESPRKGEDWDESVLKGQTASIETTLCQAPSGREYVRLKWLPGVKPLPKDKKAKAAPPKATPAPAFTEDADDIPF